MATLRLGDQAAPVTGDHGVEVIERRVHVHGAHAIDVTVGRREGLDALLEFTGQIQQPTARRDDRQGRLAQSGTQSRQADSSAALSSHDLSSGGLTSGILFRFRT